MENMLNELLNDYKNENEQWYCKNDFDAEWCILKIKDIKAELSRFKMVCDEYINHYTSKLDAAIKKAQNDCRYFEGLLEQYSLNIKMKETKSQATYKLPSGTIRRKFGTIEYIRDEKPLIEWCKENAPEFVKVKESADWMELKKQIKVNSDGKVIDENGMVVNGVIAEKRPDSFQVEVD